MVTYHLLPHHGLTELPLLLFIPPDKSVVCEEPHAEDCIPSSSLTIPLPLSHYYIVGTRARGFVHWCIFRRSVWYPRFNNPHDDGNKNNKQSPFEYEYIKSSQRLRKKGKNKQTNPNPRVEVERKGEGAAPRGGAPFTRGIINIQKAQTTP